MNLSHCFLLVIYFSNLIVLQFNLNNIVWKSVWCFESGKYIVILWKLVWKSVGCFESGKYIVILWKLVWKSVWCFDSGIYPCMWLEMQMQHWECIVILLYLKKLHYTVTMLFRLNCNTIRFEKYITFLRYNNMTLNAAFAFLITYRGIYLIQSIIQTFIQVFRVLQCIYLIL
jgi:hypothetical protein